MLTSRNSGMRQRARNKDGLAKQASAITESLVSINKKLTEQVSHSEKTKSTLLRSSNTVTGTMEEFKNMGAHIGTSQKLLSKYNRRQLTDKFLIFLALVFFIATVLYIIKKRLWWMHVQYEKLLNIFVNAYVKYLLMYCSKWMKGIWTLHKQLIYQIEYYIICIEF